jgi:hypothetical protein
MSVLEQFMNTQEQKEMSFDLVQMRTTTVRE